LPEKSKILVKYLEQIKKCFPSSKSAPAHGLPKGSAETSKEDGGGNFFKRYQIGVTNSGLDKEFKP